MSLASTPKHLQPTPEHVATEGPQSRQITGNGVILEIPPYHLLQPFHRSRYIGMHAPTQFNSNFFEFGCQALADRLPANREFARLVVRPTNVGET
jgi:hypothetical protein